MSETKDLIRKRIRRELLAYLTYHLAHRRELQLLLAFLTPLTHQIALDVGHSSCLVLASIFTNLISNGNNRGEPLEKNVPTNLGSFIPLTRPQNNQLTNNTYLEVDFFKKWKRLLSCILTSVAKKSRIIRE